MHGMYVIKYILIKYFWLMVYDQYTINQEYLISWSVLPWKCWLYGNL